MYRPLVRVCLDQLTRSQLREVFPTPQDHLVFLPSTATTIIIIMTWMMVNWKITLFCRNCEVQKVCVNFKAKMSLCYFLQVWG